MPDLECDVSQGERWLGSGQQSDYAACKKACEGTPQCQSVTFYDSGSCSLFSTKCEKTKYHANARSELVKELKKESGVMYGMECDVSQGEVYLRAIKNTDFAACKKSCEDDAHCHSVTFYNHGECGLFATSCDKTKAIADGKSKLVKELEEHSPEQCEIDGTCHIAHGEECDRTDFEEFLEDGSGEKSYEACKQACMARDRCQSITYYSFTRECSLFKTQCTHRKPHKGAVAVTLKADYFNAQECDADAGESYLSASSGDQDDLAACRKSCEDAPQCRSTTYFRSGYCSHFSTCCENRKPSPTGTADAIKTAQCVDRCVIENGGCDHHRHCTSTRGVATCGNCPAPFINDGASGCKNPAPVDPCKKNNGGCDNKRACMFANGRVTCGNCPAGFTNNGVNGCSKAVDRCKTNNGGCHAARKCTFAHGKVRCGNCPSGYVNNGMNSCTVADRCKTNNGGCDKKRKCKFASGRVTCGDCPSGYVNNGVNGCRDSPCKNHNGGCDSKRKCTVSTQTGRVTCGNCPAGFTNNGVNGCTVADKCRTNNGGCDKKRKCASFAYSNAPENKRTYSSVFKNEKPGQAHAQSMINSKHAWSSLKKTPGQWMQIDLGSVKRIAGTVVQNRRDYSGQYVKTYTVATSLDGRNWQPVSGAAYNGKQGLVENLFHSGGTRNARYVRLYIQTFNQHPSMRADVLVQSASGQVTCGDCPAGYANDGPTGCKLADRCKTNNGGCDKKRKCKFASGRVTCGDCPSGYVNNGVNGCRDSPCKNHNGGCHAARKCTVSTQTGRVTCGNCPAGFTNNGVNGCTVADRCKTNNGGCDEKRKCTFANGKVTCGNCPAGFTNNGVNGCSKVTGPCATNNGGCHKARKCTAKYFKGSKKWRVSCGNCAAGFKNHGKADCRNDSGVHCNGGACREHGKILAGAGAWDPDCCAYPKDAHCDPGFTLSFMTEADWAKTPLGRRPTTWAYCMDHGHIGNTCCTFNGAHTQPTSPPTTPSKKADPCKTNNGGCHAARKCINNGGKVTCGKCPAGFTNNGVNGCTKSAAKKCGYVFQGRGLAGPERDIVWMALGPNPTLEHCLSQILGHNRGTPCGRDYFTYLARGNQGNRGGCGCRRKGAPAMRVEAARPAGSADYYKFSGDCPYPVNPCTTNNGGCHRMRKCIFPDKHGKVRCGKCRKGANNGPKGCK